jgi:hypothetical protein
MACSPSRLSACLPFLPTMLTTQLHTNNSISTHARKWPQSQMLTQPYGYSGRRRSI